MLASGRLRPRVKSLLQSLRDRMTVVMKPITTRAPASYDCFAQRRRGAEGLRQPGGSVQPVLLSSSLPLNRHPELVSPAVTAFQDNAPPSRVILKRVQDDERGFGYMYQSDLTQPLCASARNKISGDCSRKRVLIPQQQCVRRRTQNQLSYRKPDRLLESHCQRCGHERR
jgi:hypothetical protein